MSPLEVRRTPQGAENWTRVATVYPGEGDFLSDYQTDGTRQLIGYKCWLNDRASEIERRIAGQAPIPLKTIQKGESFDLTVNPCNKGLWIYRFTHK